MVVLLLFAFISGLITIAAPCIWPLLPIVLSASATGGHRKPLGITLGIISTFGIFTLSISYIVKIIPFDPNSLRLFAVIVIVFLGLILLIPKFSAKVEGLVSRLNSRFSFGTQNKNGLIGGFITGMALGLVWAPCAGPILATIATLSATQAVNSSIVLVTITYILGIGIPLFIFASFGRRIFSKSKKLSPYLGKIQQIFGIIMILTAVLIFTNYDKIIEAKLLNYFPSYSNFLTKLESNSDVTNELTKLKGQKSQESIDKNSLFNTNTPAPDFAGITNWINSNPLTIDRLKGKVVLVDFWTYTCINCIRTLPHVTAWYNKYNKDGFVVVGVHTPEFQFEHEARNVENAMRQYNIHYPVAQDNNYATWNAYSNQYWPAEYLIDTKGNIRRVEFGEGEYSQTETAIQILLKEAGKKVDSKLENVPDQTPTSQGLSQETYLGTNRMGFYDPNGSLPNGSQTLTLNQNPHPNSFSLGGTWNIRDQEADAISSSTLAYNFFASKVYLVLRPGENSSTIKVFLDGKLIDNNSAGSDVKNGIVNVDQDRLYNLVNLKSGPEQHILMVEFSNGVRAFAFTFG